MQRDAVGGPFLLPFPFGQAGDLDTVKARRRRCGLELPEALVHERLELARGQEGVDAPSSEEMVDVLLVAVTTDEPE